jgi:hypothetical protein
MAEPSFRGLVVEARREQVEQVRGLVLGAAPRAVAALVELAESAVNENAGLGAPRAVVELSLRRSPLAPSDGEVESLVRQIIGAALRYLPAEQADNYLREVEAVATSRQSLQSSSAGSCSTLAAERGSAPSTPPALGAAVRRGQGAWRAGTRGAPDPLERDGPLLLPEGGRRRRAFPVRLFQSTSNS